LARKAFFHEFNCFSRADRGGGALSAPVIHNLANEKHTKVVALVGSRFIMASLESRKPSDFTATLRGKAALCLAHG
jgi:hypothetical protein